MQDQTQRDKAGDCNGTQGQRDSRDRGPNARATHGDTGLMRRSRIVPPLLITPRGASRVLALGAPLVASPLGLTGP